jgi:sulfatase maturation enzyme AslB (radical SAM superfamily)
MKVQPTGKRKATHLRLRSGTTLALTVEEYDRDRIHLRSPSLNTVCHAPFVSMDFDATGSVRLCNHSHVDIAKISEDISVLDIWRGAMYRGYRREMAQYTFDEDNCRHCVRQSQAGSSRHVFAVQQFDAWAHNDEEPPYPTRLIFRLNNTCNLACVMCDGNTSSRIRKEREGRPAVPPAYGERFFKEMETILPHVEHIEFYGGEPFLVHEHLRIFEILARLGCTCSIYVNTNGVSLVPRARRFLEQLNFTTIAVSMDAVNAELHGQIRKGLRHDLFLQNFDYFLELRERRGIEVMLNVTEHRRNWFELPEIFRFAERKRVHLHVNTCIHPHNVTLYTLASDQLQYVLDYLEAQRGELVAEFPSFRNLPSYDFLLSLVRSELTRRRADWVPVITSVNAECDGYLSAPIAGSPPFETPDRVCHEVQRIATTLSGPTAARMLREIAHRASGLAGHGWSAAADEARAQLRNLRVCPDPQRPV